MPERPFHFPTPSQPLGCYCYQLPFLIIPLPFYGFFYIALQLKKELKFGRQKINCKE